MTEPARLEDAPAQRASRFLTPAQQLWLGLTVAALMACGVALALFALRIDGALDERYHDALALAQRTLAAQKVAADLRRRQMQFALRLTSDGARSPQTEAALNALTDARATLARVAIELHEPDADSTAPAGVARITTAIEALAQIDRAAHDDLAAQHSTADAARDRMLNAAEPALAEIDATLAELIAGAHARTDRIAQQAQARGQTARRSLLAVSLIALGLALLLGYIGWHAMRANARLFEQLNQMAHEDALTGALNRRGLDERLPVEMARAGRAAYPLTAVMIDLDNFKRFNDRRGHQAGDRLLRDAVAGWRSRLRPMDVLARYGGEEFTLVLPVCDAEQACALIERLRPRMPDRQTFSAGVAKWNGTDSAEALLRAADAALMQAKSAGRNRTVVWGNEPQVTLPLTA